MKLYTRAANGRIYTWEIVIDFINQQLCMYYGLIDGEKVEQIEKVESFIKF